MSNLVFLQPDLDAKLFEVKSSVASEEPVDNLFLKQPSFRWASDTATSVFITLQFDEAVKFNRLWLGYTNFSSNLTYRVRSANSEGDLDSTPTHDSGTLSFDPKGQSTPHLYHKMDSVWENSWVRIDLTDSSIGNFEVGRLLIGEKLELPWPISAGFRFTYLDNSINVEGRESGIDFAHEGRIKRQFDFSINLFEKQEMFDVIEPIFLKNGKHRFVLVVINEDETDFIQRYMIYGRFSENPTMSNENMKLFAKRFQLTEAL